MSFCSFVLLQSLTIHIAEGFCCNDSDSEIPCKIVVRTCSFREFRLYSRHVTDSVLAMLYDTEAVML